MLLCLLLLLIINGITVVHLLGSVALGVSLVWSSQVFLLCYLDDLDYHQPGGCYLLRALLAIHVKANKLFLELWSLGRIRLWFS